MHEWAAAAAAAVSTADRQAGKQTGGQVIWSAVKGIKRKYKLCDAVSAPLLQQKQNG